MIRHALILGAIFIILFDMLAQSLYISEDFVIPEYNEFLIPKLNYSKSWKTDKVPKIIHQTAPSDKSKWDPMWFKCQETWRKKFPDWEYKMWTDEDLDNLVKKHFKWFYPTYSGYDKTIKRVDSARYIILYLYGGIYADMDYECFENFEDVIKQGKVSIAESKFINNSIFRESHQNALMISPALHPFWINVFKNLEIYKDFDNVIFSTGPHIITKTISEVDDNLYSSMDYRKFTENGFAKHHGTSSWVNCYIRPFQRFLYSNNKVLF